MLVKGAPGDKPMLARGRDGPDAANDAIIQHKFKLVEELLETCNVIDNQWIFNDLISQQKRDVVCCSYQTNTFYLG